MSIDKLRPLAKTSVCHKITEEISHGTLFVDESGDLHFQIDNGVILPTETLREHYLVDHSPLVSRSQRRASLRKKKKK